MDAIAEYTENYADIKKSTLRSIGKNMALHLLALQWGLTGKFNDALKRKRIQIINLHHVFDDEIKSFRRLIEQLQNDYEFISYSDSVSKLIKGVIDKPYMTITFDDGFKNCVQAAKILDDFNIKGCFFVCPAIIGESDFFKVSRFCQSQLYMKPVEFMSWDDIENLLSTGHEIGGHTMTHPDLSRLTKSEIVDEIGNSYNEIKKHNHQIEHFAWPLGRFFHFNSKCAEAVFKSGYRSCASGERGCHIPSRINSPRELCIRRDHLLASWPITHVKYFLSKNSLQATEAGSKWPYQ